ncbi:MAG: FAD-dependent oxidoreductase [Desulfobacterales bacterium]|nr:FAD-dependent oxidoreductase [Desulfobacterales bacterium]MDD4391927.1 FAD-dependent oxidoreductase [Desulfobacterales bacterium]
MKKMKSFQNQNQYFAISGKIDGKRLESRVLEEMVQNAVARGYRYIKVDAFGQHGIGGRLWKVGSEAVHIMVEGHSGQRLGSMGFFGTRIDVMGPASDDVGWLNAGADIVVHGNASNGVANAMAQGTVYIAGSIGARGMTMTKQNPRFAPPQLWVLGSVGDYFGEFMAGGIAVICGVEPQNPDNILGYRPLVGMVGGKVFFRGPHGGFSQSDARQVPVSDEDWDWLIKQLNPYLECIGRSELFEMLSDRREWQLITCRTPQEKSLIERRSMAAFRKDIWDKELGKGGLIGDLTNLDRSPIPVITSGELRRFVPVWENRQYMAPCEAGCPAGIPVQQRWALIREGRLDEAIDLALSYTPFPATVCGYLCPNLCMQNCTRQTAAMPAIDVTKLGQASIRASLPEMPPLSGKKVAVIGGGPSGISVAWQLRQSGVEATVFDLSPELGGKLSSAIPSSRIPEEVLSTELKRIRQVVPHIHLQQRLNRADVERLREDYDIVVFAGGAQKPRTLPVPGKERMITALEFLVAAKAGQANPGKRVVIIGAGNVGCDVATEAYRFGARDITLIDVQEPASFGKERDEAVAIGATFKWPCFTSEIIPEGVRLTTGEVLPADTVIVSIGDAPDLDSLPESVAVERGFVRVNEYGRTSDPKIFAIGDMAKPGLLIDAIGSGRKAASAIIDMLNGKKPSFSDRTMIDKKRITLEYFDPRITRFDDMNQCGEQCSSCGTCRDCGLCVEICPQAAISRNETGDGDFEMRVDDLLCIGCGFCASACPCGIWDLKENSPLA